MMVMSKLNHEEAWKQLMNMIEVMRGTLTDDDAQSLILSIEYLAEQIENKEECVAI